MEQCVPVEGDILSLFRSFESKLSAAATDHQRKLVAYLKAKEEFEASERKQRALQANQGKLRQLRQLMQEVTACLDEPEVLQATVIEPPVQDDVAEVPRAHIHAVPPCDEENVVEVEEDVDEPAAEEVAEPPEDNVFSLDTKRRNKRSKDQDKAAGDGLAELTVVGRVKAIMGDKVMSALEVVDALAKAGYPISSNKPRQYVYIIFRQTKKMVLDEAGNPLVRDGARIERDAFAWVKRGYYRLANESDPFDCSKEGGAKKVVKAKATSVPPPAEPVEAEEESLADRLLLQRGVMRELPSPPPS